MGPPILVTPSHVLYRTHYADIFSPARGRNAGSILRPNVAWNPVSKTNTTAKVISTAVSDTARDDKKIKMSTSLTHM